jgi:glycosyltransferase involved in cell wall biosynthesis
MSEVKVSVIVPCYNYGRFLKECLDSVRLQTLREWECIIVDNGSTDNTQEVAKSFTDQDERYKYVHTEQKGVSFARNLAISMSIGKYILPLDADDKIGNTYVEKAYNIISSNKNLKVVYCDAELFGASKGKWLLPPFSLRDLLIENSIFCSGMYSKVDFDRIHGYSEEMKEGFEDWEFWIKMLKDGGEVFKIPESLFYYRIRENSRNSALDKEKQLRLRQQIYHHHKEVYDRMFPLHELIFDYHNVSKELALLKASRDHKVGAMILSPLRVIKKLFGG